jgi:competence protein ComEA
MRGDDDLGTAADRLPLGAPARLSAALLPEMPSAAARPAAGGGWVPEPPAVPAPAGVAPSPQRRVPLWAQPWLQPPGARPLGWLALAAALALVASAWLLLHRPAGGPAPPAAASVPPATSAGPDLQIVVDVGGRVRRPGLVTLAAGARVADALRAAGGALRPADVETVDLAARVTDGQLLLIGVPQPSAAGGGAAAPVSLSSATPEQLDALPGVGPVLARRIVDWREAHGGFTALSQLQQVPGVGPRTFERLKDLVVL